MDKYRATHYERLYSRLLDYGIGVHHSNKMRIRIGLALLAVLPVILILIRWLTDSDRVVFLIIWVFCMFALCIYLIAVEYIDDSVQKILEDVTETDTEFDELIMDSEQLRERLLEHRGELHERIQERRGHILDRYAGSRKNNESEDGK